MVTGNATAKSFIVHHNGLYLRAAHELYLKQVVIGGPNRVYEIGRLLRNAGIDLTYNPGFATCECHAACADMYDIMDTTESLIEVSSGTSLVGRRRRRSTQRARTARRCTSWN
ncbi:uncharacterized protein PHACADRAFT_258968 [Phanerochaete carnosa HHB-10118-sp]|uniref:Aminoacyl-tRNA synthetase class II (D/K/N) domain-containing protein n=1 Tax=Phanerochaete carnosa (strain HHB-10118-sp) TaxID=650164 RepID=K5W6T2_PHACS|nr:uncharacterized protein PHACADRAFT_258968 [Phanerochaete carnosa HHB-10118-sp]EKM54835.1 hypothetical protein PHACADRAFT_258968 [Phanerochaete carnosa HHB-10118-sp]